MTFLFIHWEIFLAQILYSWLMIIRFYHFLDSTWKRSLLLLFFDFLINLLLLCKFIGWILIFMHISLNNILLRWPIFWWRKCSRWLIIWLYTLVITFFCLQFLIPVAWISLSIYLSFWSLLDIAFVMIFIIMKHLVCINKLRTASCASDLFHFLGCCLVYYWCLIYLIESFHIKIFYVIWCSYHLSCHSLLIFFSTFICQYIFIH